MSTAREIKFRAWDGKTMHTLYSDTKEHNHYLQVGVDGFWLYESISGRLVTCSKEDGVLMQFTGLRDRNGKEIYDGDLPGDIYEGGRVQWCEECHGWSIGMAEIEGHCHQCDGDFMWLDFADDVKAGKVEIIGNRFEHPHLLNS